MAGPGFRLRELVERFGGELVGGGDGLITGVATLRNASEGDLAFLANPRYRSELAATRAGAVALPAAEREATERPRVVARDPYLFFARVSSLLHPPPPVEPGVHPSAVVEPGAQVAPSASVGAHCHVATGAVVGERAALGPGCSVGRNAHIGRDSRLAPRVTVGHGCTIGERAIVHSGVVIGADGFGFAQDGGHWVKIPQIGAVRIGDDVEIGANTTIDRGALDDTVIEDGVKLDNQIQIGHNCRIGAHTAIAGCVGIAGSTTVGRHCMIGGAAMLSGHITLGDRVVVAGGTAITRSVAKPGFYTGVYPFEESSGWTRNAVWVRKLAELAARVKRLERGGDPPGGKEQE